MKTCIYTTLIAVIIAISPLTSLSQEINEAYVEELQALTLNENLLTPRVSEKYRAALKEHMRKEALSIKHLNEDEFKVESMRHGEVIVVTIATDKLFAPNDTLLIDNSGNKYLKPFLHYIQQKGKYKLLLAVHSDNTGSKSYTIDLTTRRVDALYNWFDSKDRSAARLVFGYPMGDIQPLVPNDTRANRATNRRLEIFIVPEKELIDTFKHKK